MLFLPKSKIFDVLICDISTFKVLDHADFFNLTRQITGCAAHGSGNLNMKSSKKGDNHVGNFHKDCPNLITTGEKRGAALGSGILNMKFSKEGVDRNGSFPDPRNLDGFFICKSIIYRRF